MDNTDDRDGVQNIVLQFLLWLVAFGPEFHPYKDLNYLMWSRFKLQLQ